MRWLFKPLLDRIEELETEVELAWSAYTGADIALRKEQSRADRAETEKLRADGRRHVLQVNLDRQVALYRGIQTAKDAQIAKLNEAAGFFYDVAKAALEKLPPEEAEQMQSDIEFYKIKAKESGN